MLCHALSRIASEQSARTYVTDAGNACNIDSNSESSFQSLISRCVLADDAWRLSLAVPLFTSPVEGGEAPLQAVAEWLAANIHDEQQPAGVPCRYSMQGLTCCMTCNCCKSLCGEHKGSCRHGEDGNVMPGMLKRQRLFSGSHQMSEFCSVPETVREASTITCSLLGEAAGSA